VGKGTALNC